MMKLPSLSAGMPETRGKFMVATPGRTVCDDHARTLAGLGLLRTYAIGQGTGTAGIPDNLTELMPLFALWAKITWKLLPHDLWESVRTAAHPVFDIWARSHLQPGDHVISSYGYANLCFKKARKTGGKTFLDAGNSHFKQYWEIVREEHARWGVRRDPFPRHWYERGLRMLDDTDFVISPSNYVTDSFTKMGWDRKNILYVPYPVDLHLFQTEAEKFRAETGALAPSADTPLRVICTGSVSLRKGIPYLLEAVRIINRHRPAVLVLTDVVEGSMKPIFPKFGDVPIEWSPPLPHAALARHLAGADVFALLSLEDGFARTVTEAMACGLPVVVSENTGAKDFVDPGINGEIVPIRDPRAAAEAILKLGRKKIFPEGRLGGALSYESARRNLLKGLTSIKLCPENQPEPVSISCA